MDYQALMTKYEEDVAYYKELVTRQQERSSVDIYSLSESPSPVMMNQRMMQELKESEENYIKQQKEYQAYIRELESKISTLEEEAHAQNSSYSVVFEDSKDPDEDIRIQIQSLEEQVSGMKEALESVEKELEETREELSIKSFDFDRLTNSYEEIMEK